MKTANYKPKGFQLDSNNLSTEKVQFWTNGIMSTLMQLAEAKILVINKKAFVISDQAIGSLENGYSTA